MMSCFLKITLMCKYDIFKEDAEVAMLETMLVMLLIVDVLYA